MISTVSDLSQSNTALIVIDIINSCCHQQCEIPKWKIHFSKIRAMVPKLQTFITYYRENINHHVVLSTTTPWQKDYLPDNINTLYTDPNACYYSEDTTGFAEQFYHIQPQATDFIIAKNHYDVFTQQPFIDYLQERNIQHIVMTGVFADGCVLASICGGFSKGYNFTILKDLIETTDDPVRQELQKHLKAFTWPFMYGKTMKAEEFLAGFSV